MLPRLIVLACLLRAGDAAADEPPVATYAIVVGSNTGGPGQAELRYAEDDARKVAALLVELGGYQSDHVDVVVHPTPDQLRDRLGKLGERVAADAAAGRQSKLFFYYSGHARAAGIDLGGGELALEELRTRLFDVHTTLTVVVLDACQSGAFSRVKGAQPAADFSWSSRQHLDASGVAVLASSSGSELSQESEQLRASYFTHHLLVGLRGAGDANGDGEVSIDEAYRYAYHQTLLSTAETAVGGQHVTFEADLKGHGEVALSFVRAATSALVLPAALEGQTLVEDRRAHVVVAETYKAKGAPVRIAVAPGDYEVIVRHGTSLSRCEVTGGGVIDLDRCATEAIRTGTTKGAGFERPLRIDIAAVIGPERHDGYTDSLAGFGYHEDAFAPSTGIEAMALRQITRHVWIGGRASYVTQPRWSHSVTGADASQHLDWNVTTIDAIARAEQPFDDGGYFGVYEQIAAGLGIGRTHLTDVRDMVYTDTYVGPSFAAGTGLFLWAPGIRGLGFTAGYELGYAPVIKDLIGNTHASGGHRLSLGASYSF